MTQPSLIDVLGTALTKLFDADRVIHSHDPSFDGPEVAAAREAAYLYRSWDGDVSKL